MIGFFDHLIEKLLKKHLHKKRQGISQKTIDEFTRKNNPSPQLLKEFIAKLEVETDRIYPIVDRSILHERIVRARWTFWIGAIASVIIVLTTLLVTGGLAFPIVPVIIPLLTACVAWLIALVTIPFAYDQRIKGAMDSTVTLFEKQMQDLENLALEKQDMALEDSQEMAAIKVTLREMSHKIETLTQQLQIMAKSQPQQPLLLQAAKKNKKEKYLSKINLWKKISHHHHRIETEKSEMVNVFQR